MLFLMGPTGMDVQEAMLRMSFSRSAARSPSCWEAVRQELTEFARETQLLRRSPDRVRELWNERYSDNQAHYELRISPNRLKQSSFSEPCATVEIEFNTPDAEVMAASRFLVRGSLSNPKLELLETAAGVLLPINLNDPMLQGNRLVLAGMGSLGAMRESPILQMYKRENGRWKLAQTILRERFAGRAYWGIRQGQSDPNHFVMEVPTDSELTREQHPASDRTIVIEHWAYRDGRYELARSHVWDTAFHAAEVFTIALMHRRSGQLKRYASSEIVRQALAAGLGKRPSPFKLAWMSESAVDFSRSYSSEEPPIRLILSRGISGWRVVKVIPRCTAADTWYRWSRAYDRSREKRSMEPPYPVSRALSARDTHLHR